MKEEKRYFFIIPVVIANFMYQLDWATGCLNIQLNITLEYVCEGVSG